MDKPEFIKRFSGQLVKRSDISRKDAEEYAESVFPEYGDSKNLYDGTPEDLADEEMICWDQPDDNPASTT